MGNSSSYTGGTTSNATSSGRYFSSEASSIERQNLSTRKDLSTKKDFTSGFSTTGVDYFVDTSKQKDHHETTSRRYRDDINHSEYRMHSDRSDIHGRSTSSSYRDQSSHYHQTKDRDDNYDRRDRITSKYPPGRHEKHYSERSDKYHPEKYHSEGSSRSISGSAIRKNTDQPSSFLGKRDRRDRSLSPISPLTLPLDQWPRKLRCWDIPPSGFEGMSTAQVKNTGLFIPATYQPKVTNLTPFVDPARTTFLFHQSSGGSSTAPFTSMNDQAILAAKLNPALAKQARRLYIAGFPSTITPRVLEEFFNDLMESYAFASAPGSSVEEVVISLDKSYAFVDLRTPTEATSALAFDGITMEGHILKVRRPKDYTDEIPMYGGGSGMNILFILIGSSGDVLPDSHRFISDENAQPHQISRVVPDSMNKLFIGNIPYHFGDDEVIAILSSFGDLRSFNLVRDPSGFSKGYAFCEFVNPELTDLVVEGLHMFELGDKKLTVQKAMCNLSLQSSTENNAQETSPPNNNHSTLGTTIGSLGGGPGTDPASILLSITNGESLFGKQTHILQLMNMVSADDLELDSEFHGITDDIRSECSKFGNVLDIWIPRPDSSGTQLAAVGKIFVKFEKVSQTTAALQALAGRQFLDRTVLTAYYDEGRFETRTIQ